MKKQDLVTFPIPLQASSIRGFKALARKAGMTPDAWVIGVIDKSLNKIKQSELSKGRRLTPEEIDESFGFPAGTSEKIEKRALRPLRRKLRALDHLDGVTIRALTPHGDGWKPAGKIQVQLASVRELPAVKVRGGKAVSAKMLNGMTVVGMVPTTK